MITALDNTWGAGIAFNAFDLGDGAGCDIVMQALTKFPSGGGDVLMGSVTTRDEALHLKLKMAHMRLGLGVAGNDAELVLRSLPSHRAALRRARPQRARAGGLAASAAPKSCACCTRRSRVRPGHAHWRATCTAAAGLFSMVFDARFEPAQVDALRRCAAAVQDRLFLGRPGQPGRALRPRQRCVQPAPHAGTLVRLSIGLEAEADLRADLAQALSGL